jgi:hypothetical protein
MRKAFYRIYDDSRARRRNVTPEQRVLDEETLERLKALGYIK